MYRCRVSCSSTCLKTRTTNNGVNPHYVFLEDLATYMLNKNFKISQKRGYTLQEIDLIITGAKVLLLDTENTCLENAAVAINSDEIVAVGHTEK